MTITLIVFIIQMVIIFAVIIYIYFTFRHVVNIPSVREYIEQISPGLVQLTATQDVVKFWFYSLSTEKYHQYTLDSDMNIIYKHAAIAPDRVAELNSGYYFNVSLQRWEKKTPHDNTLIPTLNQNGSVEQIFTLCYILSDTIDAEHEEICHDVRNQTFIKMQIEDNTFVWSNGVLNQYSPSVFPTVGNTCMYTTSRYKQHLGLSVDTEFEDDNIEQEMGVYFVRVKTGDDVWKLQECERPDDMIFNGTTCIDKTLVKHGGNKNSSRINSNVSRIRDEFIKSAKYSNLTHIDVQAIESHYVQLNNTYSMYVNLNLKEKMYSLDSNYYKSCMGTIFLVGREKKNRDKVAHTWVIEQLVNNETRNDLLNSSIYCCPIFHEPHKIFYCRSGEIIEMSRRYVIYGGKIFYMQDFIIPIIDEISNMTNFTIADNYYDAEIVDSKLLPHTRKYTMRNRNDITCDIYCTFVGQTIFDMYIETHLLVDYVDKDLYEFYGCEKFPTIQDDFYIDTWSCAQEVNNPNMFTYISLVEIYGMQDFATSRTLWTT